MQAKRAQEAKIAAEELLSAANEAASASAAALERSRLTSSDVSPTPHQQARHNSLATDTEGPSSPTSAQQQHLTSTLSTISSASVEDAPGGTVTGLDLSPTEARSPLNTASAAASPTAATAASTSAVTSAAAATAAAKLELASASDSREFLIRLERELIATGTNFNPDGSCKRPGPQQQPRQSLGGDEEDPLKCFDAANAAGAGDAHRRASWDKNSAELMKLLNIDESELGKGSGTTYTCRLCVFVCVCHIASIVVLQRTR